MSDSPQLGHALSLGDKMSAAVALLLITLIVGAIGWAIVSRIVSDWIVTPEERAEIIRHSRDPAWEKQSREWSEYEDSKQCPQERSVWC